MNNIFYDIEDNCCRTYPDGDKANNKEIHKSIQKLQKENQQLKKQLELSEKARKEAIEYINKTRIPIEDGNSEVGLFDTIWGEELLNILDIDKGDE